MSRSDLYFLDPHTWISQLPEEALQRLEAHGQDAVTAALARLGPEAWRAALVDSAPLLPNQITNQGCLAKAFAAPLTDRQILTLAVFWTRYRLCMHMRSYSATFHLRKAGRTARLDLEAAGELAARLLLFPPRWVLPFHSDGRFDWSAWHDAYDPQWPL